MRLSTKSRYGVRALFDIAYHSPGTPAQIKDISRRQQISPRYLEQIFQQLKRARILGSKRGPNGGYFLLKDPSQVSVGDIVRATEGPFDLVYCTSPTSRRKCPRAPECVTRSMWAEVGDQIAGFFDSISIQELCRRAEQKGVEREHIHPYTYHI